MSGDNTTSLSDNHILANPWPGLAGDAVAGSTTTITLPAAAVATDNFYKGAVIAFTQDASAPSDRLITKYDGTTRVATFTPASTSAVEAGDGFTISGHIAEVTSSTSRQTLFSSAVAEAAKRFPFIDSIVRVIDGTGAGRSRRSLPWVSAGQPQCPPSGASRPTKRPRSPSMESLPLRGGSRAAPPSPS